MAATKPASRQAEKKLLAHFVTNLDQNVFGFTNLPEVVIGAIFAAYSRSPLSAREILVQKFLGAEEFSALAAEFTAGEPNKQPLVSPAKAEAFYDRVLVQYGDDSVAELATSHLAIENVSNVVVKLIEDRRIGLNPLEKSSRYVLYNDRDRHGRYRYWRGKKLVSAGGEIYTKAMDELFDTYSRLIEPLKEYMTKKYPRSDQSDAVYAAAVRAQACDCLRYLLPMGTLTNVGLVGNGRAFEHLALNLLASPLEEARIVAADLLRELRRLLPAFVRRVDTDRGRISRDYLVRRADFRPMINLPFPETPAAGPSVRLITFDRDGEAKVAAALLWEHQSQPLDAILTALEREPKETTRRIIRDVLTIRRHRTHKPSRAFEHTVYTFDIVCDIGAFRDLHRHRMMTQQRQDYTTDLGFVTPADIVQIGQKASYEKAMLQARKAYETLRRRLPDEAQYAVPFGYMLRWTIKLNAREAFHLCELRSTIQGHWSYRWIAQQMARAITAVHPSIGDGMMVDWSESGEMARLKAEDRQEQKRLRLGFARDY